MSGRSLYFEMWGDSTLLDGWEDDNDRLLVGSFNAGVG
jgi:hypothetical protein